MLKGYFGFQQYLVGKDCHSEQSSDWLNSNPYVLEFRRSQILESFCL